MRKIAVITAGLVAGTLFTAPAAQAEDWIVHITQGKDDAWGYAQKVVVADHECDSHNVRVIYYITHRTQGVAGPYYRKDDDGCNGQAWVTDWAGTGWHIQKMALQERQDDGAWSGTGWYLVTEWA